MSTLISEKWGRRSRRASWVVLGLGGQAVVWANCSGGGYPHMPEGPFVDAGHGLVRHVPSQTVGSVALKANAGCATAALAAPWR